MAERGPPPLADIRPLADTYRRPSSQGQGYPAPPAPKRLQFNFSDEAPGDAILSTVLDIPESQLTQNVRGALQRLIADVVSRQDEIDRRAAHERFLDDQSHRCEVTGLLNRRGLARELGWISAHMARGGDGGILALFHLDGLESLRRGMGLAAADAVGGHVGGVLSSGLRQSDVAAALGGGDFAVFLALCGLQEAEVKAGSLAVRINSPAFHWQDRPCPFTIAVGYAYVGPDSSLQSLLAEADADLRPMGLTQ